MAVDVVAFVKQFDCKRPRPGLVEGFCAAVYGDPRRWRVSSAAADVDYLQGSRQYSVSGIVHTGLRLSVTYQGRLVCNQRRQDLSGELRCEA